MVSVNTRWEVYEFICKNKAKGVLYDDICSTFGYSLKKAKRIINKLIKDGVIFGSFHPYPWTHFLSPELKKKYKLDNEV